MSRIFEALRQSFPDVDPADAESIAGSPLISIFDGDSEQVHQAQTFALPSDPSLRLVAAQHPHELAAEKLRLVATKLKFLQQRSGLKSLLVTSAACGDGKTMISANLAITLAKQGEKTLLIDGDLHQRSLTRVMGASTSAGLSDWYQTRDSLGKYLRRATDMPLWLLGSGVPHPQPLSILQAEETAAALKQLASSFSWIIIDSPPLLPLADANVLVMLTEATLLVVRHGSTPKKLFEKAIEQLDRAKLFGVVVNDSQTSEQKYYKKYYGRSSAEDHD
jgi:capsular exopolysaccharide synthesis family protein